MEEWTSKAKPFLQDPVKRPGPVATTTVAPNTTMTHESVREHFKAGLQDLDIIESAEVFTVRPKHYLGSSWAGLNAIAKDLGGK